jgi:hypothetical protein
MSLWCPKFVLGLDDMLIFKSKPYMEEQKIPQFSVLLDFKFVLEYPQIPNKNHFVGPSVAVASSQMSHFYQAEFY